MTAPGFAAVADAHPGRLAVVDAGRPGLTYAELLSRVDRLAHALDAWEVPPAGVVTSVLPNRREYHELRLATGRTGRYFTPLSHHLRPPEISYLLADSGTPLCLVDRTTRGLLEEALALPEAPTGVRVVEVGEEYESVLAEQPVGPPGRLTAGDFMGYTSGTTGRPKGVRKPLSGGPPGPSSGTTQFMARLGMEPGQVWYRPLSPVEYLGDPAKTAEAVRDGWVTTGDLGHLDEDGWLYLADRRTDLILTGGVNVYPAEVEAALLGHPEVADAAVIGVPDDDWGQRVVALLRLEDEADREGVIDRVGARLRDVLAGPKLPREVHLVDELPRSAEGKLLRRDVAAYDADVAARTAPSTRPEENR